MIYLKILTISVLLSSYHSEPIDAAPDPKRLFDDSDFVGVVQLANGNNQNPDVYAMEVVESYKGSFRYVGISPSRVSLDDEQTYLLFADLHEDNRIAHIYSIIEYDHISTEAEVFLSSLPCFVKSEAIQERMKDNPSMTGACERVYSPVCGCDGITYGNMCEMRNAGIVRFRKCE